MSQLFKRDYRYIEIVILRIYGLKRLVVVDHVFEEAHGVLCDVTHNHPEGDKGAQAVVAAVFLARTGRSKNDIKNTCLLRRVCFVWFFGKPEEYVRKNMLKFDFF